MLFIAPKNEITWVPKLQDEFSSFKGRMQCCRLKDKKIYIHNDHTDTD